MRRSTRTKNTTKTNSPNQQNTGSSPSTPSKPSPGVKNKRTCPPGFKLVNGRCEFIYDKEKLRKK
jgi:hypothetical protein